MADNTTDVQQLVQACTALSALPVSMTDAHTRAFFTDFPLERIFRALAGVSSPSEFTLVSDVLGKVLSTDLGQSLLYDALPYLEAASTAPAPQLRRLAAGQYGNLLMAHARRYGDGGPIRNMDATIQTVCLELVRVLTKDADTAVAAAAARALQLYGRSSHGALRGLLGPGAPVAAALAAAAEADRSGAVRLRVLSLSLELAAGCEGPAAREQQPSTNNSDAGAAGSGGDAPLIEYDERLELLRSSGLLQPLLQQLGDTKDPLACLAALQLLEDLMAAADGSGSSGGGHGEGLAAALVGVALPYILKLVSEPLLADAALPLVAGIVRRALPEALSETALAAAISGAVGNGAHAPPPPPAVGSAGDDVVMRESAAESAAGWRSVLHAAPALLGAVRQVLDERGDASAAAEASGLDALATLGQSRAGAQLLLADGALVRSVTERALGRSPHPEVRMAALHGVASLGGLERAGQERCRAAALLPAQCEEALRVGVFTASGPRRRPGEVLLGLLQQPFAEMRLATYRCIAALALRSWFAVEVVTTPDLYDRLTSAASESGAAGCSWRHAAAAALWATVSAAAAGGVVTAGEESYGATLAAPSVMERLRAAVQAGPYGTNGSGGAAAAAAAAAADANRMHEQHFVATRGGGGSA